MKKTYALFGINVYDGVNAVFICAVPHLGIHEAADVLGGKLIDVGSSERDKYRSFFIGRQTCGVFVPGRHTFARLAEYDQPADAPDADLDKLAEQYRLQGVVRSGFDGMEVELVGGKFNLTDVAARIGLGQLQLLWRQAKALEKFLRRGQ